MTDDQTSGHLHIDGDWKEEAAREKERFAREEQGRASTTGAAPPSSAFADMVNMIAVQAAIGLGGYKGPGGEQLPPNMPLAKHHIDMLDLLEQKTKGNLDAEEKRSLDAVLYELRMQYVQRMGQGPPAGGPGTTA